MAAILLGAVLAYGTATLLLAQGSTGGVRAALTQRVWLLGMGLQAVGFGLSFVARHDLPLLVVQPAITASVAVTVVLGAALGRWSLRSRDVAALGAVVVGLAGLGISAHPGHAVVPAWGVLGAMACALVLCVIWAQRGVRGRRRTGAVALWAGAFAGLAFSVVAIAARMLAADPLGLVRTPEGLVAVGLLGGGVVLGQALFTASLTAGEVAGPTATSHVVETVVPAVAGIVWLGDAVDPGRSLLAVACTALALVGSLLLVGHGAPTPASGHRSGVPAGVSPDQ